MLIGLLDRPSNGQQYTYDGLPQALLRRFIRQLYSCDVEFHTYLKHASGAAGLYSLLNRQEDSLPSLV